MDLLPVGVENLKCVRIFPPKIIKTLTPDFLLLFVEKNSDGTKKLRLKGNELQHRIQRRVKDVDVPMIIHFLNDHPDIVDLELSYNEIGDTGLSKFVYTYLKLPNNLLSLNIMHNDITEKGIEALTIFAADISLKRLRLEGNKFGSHGGKLLSLFLAANSTVEYFDIAETDQTLSSMSYVLTMIRNDRGFNRSIKVLDISRIIPCFERYQYQSGHLAESIGDLLKYNTSLVEIHLQKCQFTGHDIELMMIGLKHNTTLRFLDLGYNRIGDFGIELLSSYLKARTILLGLNVAGNMIGNTGARALSFTLPFSKVRLLDISYNKIKAQGVKDLLYVINKPYIMRLLNMWGNTFDHEACKILKRLVDSGVLDPEYVDVKVYEVDNKFYAARYPSEHYKHKYYCELDCCITKPLKIKRNIIEENVKPPFKVNFDHYTKLPPIKKS